MHLHVQGWGERVEKKQGGQRRGEEVQEKAGKVEEEGKRLSSFLAQHVLPV